MSEAWIALVGTVFGGAGLKIVEAVLGRAKTKQDAATALREEYREELTDCRKESEELRDEVDHWRNRYYSLVSSITTGDLQAALRKITESKE